VHWPREGMPRSPAAWLATAARNRALDVLRRLGRSDEARRAYLAALQLAPAGQPEQRLLQRRLSEL
jgi:RNA polymerase sigma-70 factor, ECF subfamily